MYSVNTLVVLVLLCVFNESHCIIAVNSTFNDFAIVLSQYNYTVTKNGLFAINNGNLRYYLLQSDNTYSLSFTIYDPTYIFNTSSASIDGNNLLVGTPVNRTSWKVALYAPNFLTLWVLQATVQNQPQNQCYNVGKSVQLFKGGTEFAIGGDYCLLFYSFIQNQWTKTGQIDNHDGGNLAIGNNYNLITSSGPLLGSASFGDNLVNNLYCRNNANATWGTCLPRQSAYGSVPSKNVLCLNNRVFWLSVTEWGTYGLDFFSYDTRSLNNTLLQTEMNVYDYNFGVSSDCTTIAFNYIDPATQAVSIRVMTLNQSGMFQLTQTIPYARTSSPHMPYIFNGNNLIVNIGGVTNILPKINLFVSLS